MRKFPLIAALLAACGAHTASTFGAAAAAAGNAVTSCTNLPADPIKRRCIIQADPVGILDFQFTMQFDPTLVHIVDRAEGEGTELAVDVINGYTPGLRGGDTSTFFTIFQGDDSQTAFVTVQGYWNNTGRRFPVDRHVNVFQVEFELNDIEQVPDDIDQELIFYSKGIEHPIDEGGPGVLGLPEGVFGDDFMRSGQYNRRTGTPIYGMNGGRDFGPGEINQSTTGFFTIRGTAAVVPLPTAFSAGLAAGPLALLFRRRRVA